MSTPESRAVWLAIITIVAVLAGAGGGALARGGGANLCQAVMTGAGTFAGAELLLLAVLAFVAGR